MKVVIFYKPNSEHESAIDAFIHDFKRLHDGNRLEIVDADTRDGTASSSLYDIMQYPAILAISDDGSVLKSWEGDSLPLMDEVSYYTHG